MYQEQYQELLYVLSQLTLRYSYYPHIMDEKTEAKGG